MEHSNYNPYKNNQGFTLIEVLIAITVLAFITFSTATMVDTNIRTKERVGKEDGQVIQTLTAIGRLDSDISQLYNPLFSASKSVPKANDADNPYAERSANANGPFDGKTTSGDLIPQFKSEEKSTIIFLTQANRRKMEGAKESRLAWVKYSLKAMEPDPDNPDEKTSGLYNLVRQSIATDIYKDTLDWDSPNGPKSQIVLERVKTLEFSFWNERAKKYTTSLQELNENKNLVRSIKLDLVWVDDDNKEQKIEKTFRVLNPVFDTKKDAIQNMDTGPSGAFGAGGDVPPNLPNPNIINSGDDDED